MTKVIRQHLKIIADLGIEVCELRHGKHVVARCAYRGRVVIACIPRTPSDFRSARNFRSQLRNQIARIDSSLSALDTPS